MRNRKSNSWKPMLLDPLNSEDGKVAPWFTGKKNGGRSTVGVHDWSIAAPWVTMFSKEPAKSFFWQLVGLNEDWTSFVRNISSFKKNQSFVEPLNIRQWRTNSSTKRSACTHMHTMHQRHPPKPTFYRCKNVAFLFFGWPKQWVATPQHSEWNGPGELPAPR